MVIEERNPAAAHESTPLLEVRHLVTQIPLEDGSVVTAVNDLSFSLARGESLALVGESGSGKSMSALSLMGLVPGRGRVVEGEILFGGRNLRTLPRGEMQRVRGWEIGMVFQDPATSLNPVLTIGQQLTEGLREHRRLSKEVLRAQAADLLHLVGIPDVQRRLDDYPHRFSGGQRQRIMIAMAVSCSPSLLIADEPTTALDATIQAQIVELLKELQKRLSMAILWISHDLALVAGLVDRVAVMYAGSIVEQSPVHDLFKRPRHPYTLGLLRSMPRSNARPLGGEEGLIPIPGHPPDPRARTPGCPFSPRCSMVIDRCRAERPALVPVDPGHDAACFRSAEL